MYCIEASNVRHIKPASKILIALSSSAFSKVPSPFTGRHNPIFFKTITDEFSLTVISIRVSPF